MAVFLVALMARILIPMLIKIALWIVGISLGFAGWHEWKKGENQRDVGTVVGFAVGAWLCFAIAGQL